AGGVDLGLRSHGAAAPPWPDGTPQVAACDTYTDSLEALADWLQQHGVTTVALEATGVYGEPLCAILQARGLEVLRVAPTYITGLTGRKILQAILAGARDPLTLARLRDRRCRNSADAIARALRGHWREEALFALQQAWDSWQHYQEQVRDLGEVIHQQLQRM